MAYKSMETQNAEFNAARELAVALKNHDNTPIVDDDYPLMRSRYETALYNLFNACCANGRTDTPAMNDPMFMPISPQQAWTQGRRVGSEALLGAPPLPTPSVEPASGQFCRTEMDVLKAGLVCLLVRHVKATPTLEIPGDDDIAFIQNLFAKLLTLPLNKLT